MTKASRQAMCRVNLPSSIQEAEAEGALMGVALIFVCPLVVWGLVLAVVGLYTALID